VKKALQDLEIKILIGMFIRRNRRPSFILWKIISLFMREMAMCLSMRNERGLCVSFNYLFIISVDKLKQKVE